MERAVVITGASTGIGAACALELDQLGFQVFAGVRNPQDGEKLKAKSTGKLIPLLLDVTDEKSIAQAFEQVVASTRDLHGLVNNAGIAVGGPLEFLPLSELRHQFEVNVLGQLAVTQAFLPLIRSAKGRIVNMSSIAGRAALPFAAPYAASKHALEALSDSLRLELDRWGISVSIIEPGTIATPIWEKSLSTLDDTLRSYPEHAVAYYKPALAGIRHILHEPDEKGLPPRTVAEAVRHALTAKRPKTRYVIGNDAKLRLFLNLFPDRFKDWVILKRLQLR